MVDCNVRNLVFFFVVIVTFSCSKKKVSKPVVDKRSYTIPYHYNSNSNDTSIKLITHKKSNSITKEYTDSTLIDSTTHSLETVINNELENKPKKKIHLPSVGSIATETVAFGSYYFLSQQLSTGIIASLLLSVFGLLATLLSLSVAMMAYLHFLKHKDKFWGSAFSISALYSTALVYILLSVLSSAILSLLGIPLIVLIGVSILLTIGYTYFFIKFIRSMKK